MVSWESKFIFLPIILSHTACGLEHTIYETIFTAQNVLPFYAHEHHCEAGAHQWNIIEVPYDATKCLPCRCPSRPCIQGQAVCLPLVRIPKKQCICSHNQGPSSIEDQMDTHLQWNTYTAHKKICHGHTSDEDINHRVAGHAEYNCSQKQNINWKEMSKGLSVNQMTAQFGMCPKICF